MKSKCCLYWALRGFALVCIVVSLGHCGTSVGTGSSVSGGEAASDDGGESSGGSTGSSSDGGSTGSDSSGGSVDTGGGSASSGSSHPLYTDGPVNLPITIAKAEKAAPNPQNIPVTVSNGVVTFKGNADALTTTTESVYIHNPTSGVTVTRPVNATDGSFPSTSISYTGSTVTLIVAGSNADATEIGPPIFAEITPNYLTWILTNGDKLTQAITLVDGTVFATVTSTGDTSLTKSLIKSAATATSTIYSLGIGGVPSELASVSCAVDQVIISNGEVFARCGADFYSLSSSQFSKTVSVSLGSGESITLADVGYEEDSGTQIVAVATNDAVYSCLKSTGSCTSIVILGANEYISFLDVENMAGEGFDFGFVIGVVVTNTSTNSNVVTLYDPDGDVIFRYNEGLDKNLSQYKFGLAPLGAIRTHASSQTMKLEKAIFKECDVSNYYTIFENITTQYSGSGCTASDNVACYNVNSGIDNTDYLLDCQLTIRQVSGGYTLLNAEKTRTILGQPQLMQDANATIFCAEDSSGNGQLHAYCPRLQNLNREIIQVTREAYEVCDATNNWRVNDHDVVDEDDARAIVFIHQSNSVVQAGFIDPYSHPAFDGCFD